MLCIEWASIARRATFPNCFRLRPIDSSSRRLSYHGRNIYIFISKCICPNTILYLSKYHIVFVQIPCSICLNTILYLSKHHIVFVQIANCFHLRDTYVYIFISQFVFVFKPNCVVNVWNGPQLANIS